jgi:hypothetical protein
MKAFAQNGRFYLNVDRSMKIFKNKQCSDITFNAIFEALIDTLFATTKGRYHLVCLKNEKAHLLDCNNEFNCIFSQYAFHIAVTSDVI